VAITDYQIHPPDPALPLLPHRDHPVKQLPRAVLDRVAGCGGRYALIARLLYGTGMRVKEA
jgi:hypothetical protein